MTPASIETGPAPEPGHGRIRRSFVSPDQLITEPYPGVETVTDVLHYTVRTHGNKPAWGYRDIVKVHEEEKMVKKIVGGQTVEEKKIWKFFELSDYKYFSYADFSNYVHDVSAALISLGLPPSSIFNVYASTCLNWQVMQHAILMAGSTIATAYDTLGESGLTHSLNEPGCIGIFTHADLLPVVSRVIANTPSVKFVVYDGDAKQQVLEKIRGSRDDVQAFHIDELRAKGKEVRSTVNFDERAPKPEDTACIMYTSGTTGAPKGVVLSHSNLVSAVGAIIATLEHLVGNNDLFIAYLPLAHILEYIVELAFFCFGITIGFGNIKTLTDASVRNCLGDLRSLKPTIMIGVPAVWETIRKGITSKVEKMPQFKKSIFNGTMALKKMVPALGGVLDATILNAVKTATGGRLRFALSGGAPISRETQEFLNIALVNLLQGYGLTESCGMCAILTPDYFNYGVVGAPSPAIEIKLVDAPEAGYFSTNDPPRGEVWVRGPAITKGYFKRDDLNSDTSIFPGDGWFRTGDIGQWNSDGTLSLIDRIKNLVKLSGGEYIALERLESTYKACSLVSNICVHAHSDAKQPMAIVIPHKEHLLQAIAGSSDPQLSALKDKELHALVHERKVADLFLKEMNALGKKNGFKPMETLEAVVLTDMEWTPENGLVTAAQKIQRKKIAQEYASEIKAVYPY